jgi:protein-S-isoprenylcysteine O-methyltransferase Ste14
MKRIVFLIYGVVAYAAFALTFGYAICFIGNLFVPKTIDSGAQSDLLTSVVINALLLSLFAAQHSIMARKGFKRVWTQIVPKQIERPTYVLASSAALALILWQWRPMPQVLWEFHGIAAGVLSVTFWLGWALLLTSSFLINHFELFGLQQVWGYFRNKQYGGTKFRTPILYRIVRHPLYLGFMIAFWSAPRMSVGHLIFSLGCTGYILLGIALEERDLVAEHGESYRRYREQVPMLLPLPKMGSAESDRSRSVWDA